MNNDEENDGTPSRHSRTGISSWRRGDYATFRRRRQGISSPDGIDSEERSDDYIGANDAGVSETRKEEHRYHHHRHFGRTRSQFSSSHGTEEKKERRFERRCEVNPSPSEGSSVPTGIGWRDKGIAFFSVVTLYCAVGAFSCVPLWGLKLAFASASITGVLLFLPFNLLRLDPEKKSRTVPQCLLSLVKFPLFWLGLLLLGYLGIQVLNPQWGVVVRTFYWHVYPIPHTSWLPAGINAPIETNMVPGGMNSLRQLLIFSTAWFVLCALWAGVKSRKALAAVVWASLIGAVVIVAWGGQMRISRVNTLLGTYNTLQASFFGTFLYQNQASAWLSLQFSLAVSLALWHWGNTRRKAAKSGPHLACAAIALWLVFGVIFSFSFGGLLTTSILLLLVTPFCILWGLARRGVNKNVLHGGIVATLLIASLAFVFFKTSDLSYIEGKIARKFNLAQTNSLDNREPLRRVTWDMIHFDGSRYAFWGYGAGSFRWVSPGFFRQHTEFVNPRTKHLARRANNVHCDWLQMLAEWGYAGFSIVAAAFLSMVLWFLANIRRWTPSTVVLLCAITLFAGHAAMDFLNYNVPILVTLAILVPFAARVTLEPKRKTLS